MIVVLIFLNVLKYFLYKVGCLLKIVFIEMKIIFLFFKFLVGKFFIFFWVVIDGFINLYDLLNIFECGWYFFEVYIIVILLGWFIILYILLYFILYCLFYFFIFVK